MRVQLLSRQVFSHFGELWLAWSQGGGHYFRDVRIDAAPSRNWVPWLGTAVGIGGCVVA